ncbi:MAG: YfcC family protein, partial [Clostridiales bacterium]
NVLAVPGSYKDLESQPVGFVDFLVVIPRALEEVAGIFFFVLLIGGGIGLVSSTGAFDAMVATFLRKFGDKGRFIIFFLVYFFGLCAASAGFCSEFLVFIPIMIVLFKALGYDAMVA